MDKQLHFRFPGKSLCCCMNISRVFCFIAACIEILSVFVSEALSQKCRELAELLKGDLWEEGKTQTIMDRREYLTAGPAGWHWKYRMPSESVQHQIWNKLAEFNLFREPQIGSLKPWAETCDRFSWDIIKAKLVTPWEEKELLEWYREPWTQWLKEVELLDLANQTGDSSLC